MVRASLVFTLALLGCSPPPPPAQPAPAREVAPAIPAAPTPAPAIKLPAVAFTIDDLVIGGRDLSDDRVQAMTTAILRHITDGGVPMVAFVNSAKLGDGARHEARLGLLRQWTAAGVELANHTHSHPSLQTTPLADYEADVLRGEPDIRDLNKAHGWPLRYFRHPYLHTGPTLEIRDAFNNFLSEHHYTVAPVTIDNSDWLFNFAYTDARTRGDAELAARLGAAYVEYMAAELGFHEQAADRLFARPIRHILLLHANELNAEYLDDVIALYRARGYSFISLAGALADDAYQQPDRYAGASGVSWLYRWDVTRGDRQVDWAAEPQIPEWVQSAYEAAQRG